MSFYRWLILFIIIFFSICVHNFQLIIWGSDKPCTHPHPPTLTRTQPKKGHTHTHPPTVKKGHIHPHPAKKGHNHPHSAKKMVTPSQKKVIPTHT